MVHRRTLAAEDGALHAIADDLAGFADEQAAASSRYADTVMEDWQRFQSEARSPGGGDDVRDGACRLFDAP